MPDALVERDGPLMIVTMNRPQRMNAQSPAMLVRMYDAWAEASADDEIRCIIVTGADGNFSSGADLKAMAGDSGPNADTEIDAQARLAEDPRLMHKALPQALPPDEADHRRGRRRGDRRRHRDCSSAPTSAWPASRRGSACPRPAGRSTR